MGNGFNPPIRKTSYLLRAQQTLYLSTRHVFRWRDSAEFPRFGSFDSTHTGRVISLIKVFQPVLVHGVCERRLAFRPIVHQEGLCVVVAMTGRPSLGAKAMPRRVAFAV